MKAVVLDGPTNVEDIFLKEKEVPVVVPGWVLVKVKAFGMNHSELILRHEEIKYDYIKKPIIPGIECVGEIADPSNSSFKAGDKVIAMMGGMGRSFDGSYAEYALLPAHHVFKIESNLKWSELAAIPETYFTAWGSLFECLQLRKEDTLLIRGASCALGLAAIQIAKTLGCKVIATTHKEKYLDLLMSADERIVDDGKLTGKVKGVTKALDLVGPKFLLDTMASVEKGAIVCQTGVEFYSKSYRNGEAKLDYRTIKNALQDVCYVITINGESAERKMCFFLSRTGEKTYLQMLDPQNGISEFYLKLFDEKEQAVIAFNSSHDEKLAGNTMLLASRATCHPRGDHDCDGGQNGQCVYCDGKHNCKHKSLNIAAAVLYCFQEYIEKISEGKEIDAEKVTARKNNGISHEAYVPAGMIRLYDIRYSDKELERINKFAMFGKERSEYPSTEKSPHIRRGTMRYNPKTGQKDIKVKGSIIHKDRYEGFASADRIKE